MKIEEAKNLLLKAKEKNRMHNSYIIYGGSRKGREDVALFLSGILNCEVGNFCKKCEICKRIENRTHPDIKWIIPEKSVLSIEEVRELKNEIFVKPYYNKYKIYIFEVEYVKEEASSAFLKILEEPPEYGIILLLSPNINFFLPTIISRCFKIYINYILPEYEDEFEKSKEEFFEFFKLVENRDFFEFFKKVDSFCKSKEREDVERWMENIYFFIRDSFLYELALDKKFLINKNFGGNEEIKIYDLNLMEKIWEIKQRVKYNINLRIAVENLVFQFLKTAGKIDN